MYQIYRVSDIYNYLYTYLHIWYLPIDKLRTLEFFEKSEVSGFLSILKYMPIYRRESDITEYHYI